MTALFQPKTDLLYEEKGRLLRLGYLPNLLFKAHGTLRVVISCLAPSQGKK